MSNTFNLPRIGDAMSEGEIVEWLVAVGDVVELDQAICSIETDKSVVELTSPYRGTVLVLGGAPGDVLEVGAPLLVVGATGEAVTATPHPTTPTVASSEAGTPPPAIKSPMIRRLAADHNVDIAAVAGTGVGGRVTREDVITAAATQTSNGSVLAMPKVRKLARDNGIDLATLTGSGAGGVITTLDLDLAASPPALGSGADTRREKLTATRRAIARHLTESVQTIPQFTSTVDVDASAVVATRNALRDRLDAPVPIDAVLLALLLPVLDDHPRMNAYLDGDEIVFHQRRHIGVAVDTPDGLVVPVVRNADQLSVARTAAEIVRLADAARRRALDPATMSGATCTVNNVGAVGIETGTPILPMGTSTIIAFGRTRPMVQLRHGNPVEIPTMTLCATFDHRLIDGGDAGRFLTQLRTHLEVPALGLL